jgi:hypothetical protein
VCVCLYIYIGHTQKNGAVSKVNKKFRSLHGHKIRCQQRVMSKFLMRYQQFASHAYCGAAGPVSKMASQQEKAVCSVLRCPDPWLQCSLSFMYCLKKTHHPGIKKPDGTDSLWKLDAYVKAGVLLDLVCLMTHWKECVRHFSEVPASHIASRELGMPKMTVWKVFRKRLCFKACKMRLHQHTKWKGVNFARRWSWKWRKMFS